MERVSPNWVCLSIIGSFTFGVLGCGDVREDRTIAWSPAGDSVGFQHGRDGLYVWDAKAGQAQQIYQPPEEVIATSTPLWSPDGNRLVFLTATLDQEGCSHSSEHTCSFHRQFRMLDDPLNMKSQSSPTKPPEAVVGFEQTNTLSPGS